MTSVRMKRNSFQKEEADDIYSDLRRRKDEKISEDQRVFRVNGNLPKEENKNVCSITHCIDTKLLLGFSMFTVSRSASYACTGTMVIKGGSLNDLTVL